MLAPISSTRQIWENVQLRDRGAWVEVEHPELGTSITYPGAWSRLTESPLTLRNRAPLIGEHNEEVYEGELGIPREKLVLLKSAGVI